MDTAAYLKDVFPQFVAETLALWHVPGLAVAAIKDGQVVLLAGYGQRGIQQPLPVTADTLFPIASCTKGFTAMALGMLVDQGKLDWDAPLRKYLPDFQLYDSFASQHITTRDILSHRSGLPGHDLVWYASNFDQYQIYKRLRYLEPSAGLRCAYQYQNLMYSVAGVLIERLTGQTWESFVQAQIFDRLGMQHSNFSTFRTRQSTDYALPHYTNGEDLFEIPFLQQDDSNHGTGPAGKICSNVRDLSRWLRLLLSNCTIDGQALISAANLEQMMSPHIFTGDARTFQRYGEGFSSYGLGWYMRSHKGHYLVEHDGMTDGFYTLIAMLPRVGVGVVALSNCDAYYNPVQSNLVPNIVAYTLFDHLLGLPPTDWNTRQQTVNKELQASIQQAARPAADAPETGMEPISAPPTHPIEAYLGDYTHPGYGLVTIRREDTGLQMVINDKLVMPVEHCYHDIFEVIFTPTGQREKFAFHMDLAGTICQISARFEPKVSPILFSRTTG